MPNTDKPNYRERRKVHSKTAAEVKARKKIRGVRAEIHEAMLVAAAMRRSKKKGTGNIEANMESLGFQHVEGRPNNAPVDAKYRKMSS